MQAQTVQAYDELRRLAGRKVEYCPPGRYDEVVANVSFRPEKKYSLGIGQGCPPGGGSYLDPLCYADNTPICDMSNCPGSAMGQVGGAWFDVILQPLRGSDYFEALAARFEVVDGANEDMPRTVRITAVHVDGKPRDTMDNRAPTVAENRYISSEMFRIPEPYAVHVPWGVFGLQTSNKEMHITCFPNYAAAVTIDANVVIKGNPLPSDHHRVKEQITGTSARG